MSSERVLSVRATRVLACAGLISSDELSSSDDNAIIIEILRNAKLHHLLGKSGSAKDLADVMQWMELSQTLTAGDLPKIEASLNMKSYLVGYTFTVADAAIYEAIRSKVADSVVNFAEMSRWYSHMQNICPSAGFDTMKFGSPASHFICLPTSNAAAPRAQKSSPITQSDVKCESLVQIASVPETSVTIPSESITEVKKEKKEKKEKKTDAVAIDAKVTSDATLVDTGDDLDPSKLDIRVGVVVKCWNHPDSDKLLCEEIDVGEAVVRTIASGIRPHYAAEDLVGRKVCVLANLKDRNLAGFKSQGMVLCAVSADHSHIKLLEAPGAAKAGDRITFPGFSGEPASSAQMAKKKILEKLAPQLRTDSKGVAHWGSCAFTVDDGVCVAHELLADAVVS